MMQFQNIDQFVVDLGDASHYKTTHIVYINNLTYR